MLEGLRNFRGGVLNTQNPPPRYATVFNIFADKKSNLLWYEAASNDKLALCVCVCVCVCICCVCVQAVSHSHSLSLYTHTHTQTYVYEGGKKKR